MVDEMEITLLPALAERKRNRERLLRHIDKTLNFDLIAPAAANKVFYGGWRHNTQEIAVQITSSSESCCIHRGLFVDACKLQKSGRGLKWLPLHALEGQNE